ncbi:PKD-like family lipoprotein [Chitinophaga sp. MM2321]|uniref:PKD-like family lipoprotein n=1 Tax=Chitinophaga sp. MM2321 TaxID=3137178 RepID=UPI0032D58BFB
MKKNRSLYLFGSLLLLAAIYSCRKDSSTLDVHKINGVVVDTTGKSKLGVYQFDTLKLQPGINLNGADEASFTYEWKINMEPDDTVYQVLSTEKYLAAEIRFRPNVTGKYHQLVYTVTDKQNGLRYITPFQITVLNNIGEGLVIADSKDGIQSDINHLMMPWVTTDATKESLKYNVFSSINGKKIDGIVKQMRFYKIYGVDMVTGITSNSVFNIKTLDYTLAGENSSLFYIPRPVLKPQALGGIYLGDIYIGEGKFTAANMGATPKYPAPYDNNFVIPTQVALNPYNYSGIIIRVSFYDEVHGHFVYLSTVQSFGDNVMRKYPPVSGGAFDPSNVPGKQNLAAGLSMNKDFLHLLKDKATGKISLFVLDQGIDDYPDIIPPAPKAQFDLSNAPGIADAHHFVFADDQNVLYYTSGNKVYAVLYGTSTPSYQERYTLPAGEEVTVLQIYQQGNYPNVDATLNTNKKILIMATYDGNQGKLLLLPMINPGLGNLDIANGKVYDGFGKISSVTAQK